MSAVVKTAHDGPLPGLVLSTHGIVGLDPWAVQCDGCHVTHEHSKLMVAASEIRFNPLRPGDDRRLCAECARREWPERAA